MNSENKPNENNIKKDKNIDEKQLIKLFQDKKRNEEKKELNIEIKLDFLINQNLELNNLINLQYEKKELNFEKKLDFLINQNLELKKLISLQFEKKELNNEKKLDDLINQNLEIKRLLNSFSENNETTLKYLNILKLKLNQVSDDCNNLKNQLSETRKKINNLK